MDQALSSSLWQVVWFSHDMTDPCINTCVFGFGVHSLFFVGPRLVSVSTFGIEANILYAVSFLFRYMSGD